MNQKEFIETYDKLVAELLESSKKIEYIEGWGIGANYYWPIIRLGGYAIQMGKNRSGEKVRCNSGQNCLSVFWHAGAAYMERWFPSEGSELYELGSYKTDSDKSAATVTYFYWKLPIGAHQDWGSKDLGHYRILGLWRRGDHEHDSFGECGDTFTVVRALRELTKNKI